MTCDPRLLSYYRDGALSFEERYEVEDHLRECPSCTNELRGLMRLAQVVRSLPMEPVSPTLRQDVRRLVAEREERRRRPVYVLGGIGRALAPAGVAAAVAVSALVVWRPGALDLQNHPAPVPYAAPAAANPPSVKAPDAPAVVVQGNPVASLPKGPSASGPSVQPVRDNGSGPVQGNRMVSPTSAPDPIARFYNGNQQVRQLMIFP